MSVWVGLAEAIREYLIFKIFLQLEPFFLSFMDCSHLFFLLFITDQSFHPLYLLCVS